MNWSTYYPAFAAEPQTESTEVQPLSKDVEIVDIGCGFGGLLMALSPLLPDSLMLGG